MIKCQYCEFSQMKRGEINCPLDVCQMSRETIERLNVLSMDGHKSLGDVDRIRAESMLLAIRNYQYDLVGKAQDNRTGEIDIQAINDCAFELIAKIKEMVGDSDA